MIEDEVLRKIIPTEQDKARIDGTAARLTSLVQDYLDSHHIDAMLKLVGSYSKGTYLSNPDLDLFIMFPRGTSREELVEVGLKIGEDVLHGSRMYAEHPYTSAVFEGVDVDLVPNIHIDSTENLETAVDRTPFHTEYVLSKLTEGQNDQIRLLKKFMKGIKTYGAEPNVRGFSGYLCELLVLKYGTFRGVLEAASEKWREGLQISLEKRTAKLEGALVFYDPVDGKRNVASAVHVDTLSRFILAAKAYLKNPSEVFFFPPEETARPDEWLRDRAENSGFRIVSVSFDKPDVVADNLYSQLWRTHYGLADKLDYFRFNCLRAVHRIVGDRMCIAFIVETDTLPPVYRRMGPPVSVASSKNFTDKWNEASPIKPFVEDGKWWAIVPHQYTDAKTMLLNEVSCAGIGKEMDITTIEVLDHKETLEKADRMLLTELLDPEPFWNKF